MNKLAFFYFASSILLSAAAGPGTIWQVQNTAAVTNANGGGFDTGNANLPSDGAATVATGASPVFSSASYHFNSNDIGAWIYIQSGTNWYPGEYQVLSISGNSAVLSAAIGQAVQPKPSIGYPVPTYSTNSVVGVASVASPTGATWGIDYTQTNAAPFSGTDLVSTTGTTSPSTITSASSPFGVNNIGNIIHVLSGTSWLPGWYEIVNVSGVTATLDRAVASTASVSAGTWKLGGAISLGSSSTNQTDTNFFSGTHISSGQTIFIKGGSYTLGGGVTTASASPTVGPISIIGYSSYRGDSPTGTSRPLITTSGATFTTGGVTNLLNLSFYGSSSSATLSTGSGNDVSNVKVVSAGGTALLLTGSSILHSVEAIGYKDTGINAGANAAVLDGCYIHDSVTGFQSAATGASTTILNSIIEGNTAAAIKFTQTDGSPQIIIGNTLHGTLNHSGTGIWFSLSGNTSNSIYVRNNIISGFTNGIVDASTALLASVWSNTNDFYNNGTDVSANWAKGGKDLAVDPKFVNVGQVTGSGAITLSGNKLQDSTKNFSTYGIVANQDFVRIVSGTGVTAGQYMITGMTTTTNPNDTLTVDVTMTANATADKVYQITTGHNFGLQSGSGLRGNAFPKSFPNSTSLTKSSLDIGASQTQGGGQTGIAQ